MYDERYGKHGEYDEANAKDAEKNGKGARRTSGNEF